MQIPQFMKAMVLLNQGQPLQMQKVPVPMPQPDQVLVKVIACGICRTDLHIADGELGQPKLPLIQGHEIVGLVVKSGNEVNDLRPGDLVGIPWLGQTCGKCRF